MRVAVDISPIRSGHKVRGIGSYTKNLIEEFKKGKEDIEFEFFESSASPPPVDIVHYPYFDLFFHTLPIKKKNSRVVTIHDVIPLVFPDHFPAGIRGTINLMQQKLALKDVDAVICDSKTSKNDVVKKLSIPENKIHVVYLAPGPNFKRISDQRQLSVVAKKYRLPSRFILYVGDVNWNKNIPGLLEAIKIANVNLVIVGESPVDESLIQVKDMNAKIESLGIKNKITRTGFVPEKDLISIYNLASLTVLPSFYEGFGLPVLESMACGTPIVCSDVASLAEIGINTAIFCNPFNPHNIANKIKDVLKLTQKERGALSQKLISHAVKFNWEKVAKNTIAVYENARKTI